MAKGLFLGIQHAKGHIIAMVVFARHQLHPGRGAQRGRIAVVKTHPVFRQLIQVRGLVTFTTISAQGLVTEIIGHNKNDIGVFGKYSFRVLWALYKKKLRTKGIGI